MKATKHYQSLAFCHTKSVVREFDSGALIVAVVVVVVRLQLETTQPMATQFNRIELQILCGWIF